MSGLVETLCAQWLTEVGADKLQELCDEYKIEVPAPKVGKKDYLLKLVLRFLSSETLENSADGGQAVFLKLFNELGEILGKGKSGKKEESSSVFGGDVSGVGVGLGLEGTSAESENVDSRRVYHKLKTEFKIKGSIGDPKQSGTLDYTSLLFQIQQGKEQGFGSKEICAAVIQAIKPGHSLRGFLESKGCISEEALLQILRSHLNEKDSTSFYHELTNCVQKSGESAQAFCLNALLLREKVAKISDEEGCPFDDFILRKRFFHTIYTGLKSQNIRMELQKTLKEATISDEDLLMEISLATANEQERLGKVRAKVEEANAIERTLSESDVSNTSNSSNSSPVSAKSAGGKPSKTDNENKLLLEINKLALKVDELASVKEEIKTLKENVAENYRSNQGLPGEQKNRNNYRKVWKCANCERKGSVFCTHCFKCGSGDHRMNFCTQKN